MSPSSVLFHLPEIYTVKFFMDWVPIPELVRLDSAVCNRTFRKQFLLCLRTNAFVAQDMIHCEDHVGYLRWHVFRGVKVATLRIKHLSSAEAAAVGQAIGGGHVRTVELDDIILTVETALSAITTTCRRLERLVVTSVMGVMNIGQALQAFHQTLSTLELHGTIYTFNLNGTQLPALRTIHLTSDDRSAKDHGQPHEMLAITIRQLLRASPGLKTFRLLCGTLQADCLRDLANRGATLRHLALGGCRGTSRQILCHIAESCACLERLELYNLHLSRPVDHRESDYASDSKEDIHMKFAGEMDWAIQAFVTHCPHLNAIAITSGSFGSVVTLVGLRCIARHCGARLRRLSLNISDDDYTTDAVDAEIDTLSACCPGIESLSLTCSHASSAALARLVVAQHRLCEAGLSTTDSDDSLLQAIAQHGAHLTSLDLRSWYSEYASSYTLKGLTTALKTVYLPDPPPPLLDEFLVYWSQANPQLEFQSDHKPVPFWGLG